jgi:carbamoyl-phosphate synthase large subunit
MRILTEASGSLISAYIIQAIQNAGHTALASDIDSEIAARFLADGFIQMPRNDEPELWEKTGALLVANKVDVVLPSFDETLIGWAERKAQLLKQHGGHVILSPAETVRTFRDKWLTYKFFKKCRVPTPATSLKQVYPLVKPRLGRGSQGVAIPAGSVPMAGMISQELLKGQEFTVDVLCDKHSRPVFIVPRKRLRITSGKSVAGIVVDQPEIAKWVKVICQNAPFRGPINLQCFIDAAGQPWFTEVNPRLAGGMALSFAATDNWIGLAVRHFVEGKRISPKPVAYGLRMFRYYAEVFVPER